MTLNIDRIGAAVALGGLIAGALLIVLLPSSWLFVEESRPVSIKVGGEQYACPMFCVVMDELPDDGRCYVCGMELAPVSGESRLSSGERRMAGLEVDKVRRLPLVRTIRVVGEVDYDETRLSRITTRMEGWLEEVWVTVTWAQVEEGDKLASIYSPELYAAQREYVVALSSANDGLREGARRRLRLLGIGEKEIAELKESGTVQEALVLRAPRSGLVVEQNAIEGTAVKKGATLYQVADLDRVWIQSEVFERDLPLVRTGLTVRLEVESLPAPLRGTISFIDPVIDRRTRTARVRIEVPNEKRENGTRPLRIGQRVDAWIESPIGPDGMPGEAGGGAPLVVPKSAVLRTGERAVVYALFEETADGGKNFLLDPARLPDPVFYEMVEVGLGLLGRDEAGERYYPLRLGKNSPLSAGAVVVRKGNLLLDSQAQLSGKPSLLFPEGSRGGGGDTHAGH